MFSLGQCYIQCERPKSPKSKNRSIIEVFRGISPETLPRCPKTPPRRPQDAPRHPKTHQGRPKTAPRPCQDGSKTPPDAPRRLQVGPQRRAKAPKTPPDPRKKEAQKRSETQSIPDLVFRTFLGGFWSVFGWIWEGFGDDFGSLEVDFSRIL